MIACKLCKRMQSSKLVLSRRKLDDYIDYCALQYKPSEFKSINTYGCGAYVEIINPTKHSSAGYQATRKISFVLKNPVVKLNFNQP